MGKKIPNTEKTSHEFEESNFYEFEEAFRSLKRNKAAGFK